MRSFLTLALLCCWTVNIIGAPTDLAHASQALSRRFSNGALRGQQGKYNGAETSSDTNATGTSPGPNPGEDSDNSGGGSNSSGNDAGQSGNESALAFDPSLPGTNDPVATILNWNSYVVPVEPEVVVDHVLPNATLEDPPHENQTLADEGLYNLTAEVIESPNPTNLSIIPNPRNMSVGDILGPTLLSKRSAVPQPRWTWDHDVQVILSNGWIMQVVTSSEIQREVWQLATSAIQDAVTQYITTHTRIGQSLTTRASTSTGRVWELYTFTPSSSLPDSFILQLVWQALCTVMNIQDPQSVSPVVRNRPLLITAFRVVTSPRSRDYIMFGNFREYFPQLPFEGFGGGG